LKTVIDLFQKEAIRIEQEAKDTPNAGPIVWFLQGTVCALLHRWDYADIESHSYTPMCIVSPVPSILFMKS
jgi:GMP synthase (glutamine-hydrolysing)